MMMVLLYHHISLKLKSISFYYSYHSVRDVLKKIYLFKKNNQLGNKAYANYISFERQKVILNG